MQEYEPVDSFCNKLWCDTSFMRRFIQYFEDRQISIKRHAKNETLHKLANKIYKDEDYNIGLTILLECSKMQLIVEPPVPNDTPQCNKFRYEVESAITETDNAKLNQRTPNAPIVNTNTPHESSFTSSQVSDKVPFYISEKFRVDRPNLFGALEKYWREYISEHNHASREFGQAVGQNVRYFHPSLNGREKLFYLRISKGMD